MKIITTVGTSLIAKSGINCNSFKGKEFDENLFHSKSGNLLSKEISKKENELLQYLKNDSGTCAELASIQEIKKETDKDAVEIYLLCTETLLSYLCGKVLERFLDNKVKVEFIRGLQIENIGVFKKEGIPNLLNKIEKVAQNGIYWDDITLNVTGGYKALIPIMTLIGQINSLPIYYIFKGEEDKKYQLLKIPKMPISFDEDVFEDYFDEFSLFGIGGNEIVEFSSLSSNFIKDCEGFIEIIENYVALNPIGKILWWKYRQKYFLLKTDAGTWGEIQNQKDISRILATKFWDTELRESKTEMKQDHYVFDDGNNNNRIYYFLKNEEIYIYKTFENEENAKAYISTDFGENKKDKFIQKTKIYRIKKS